MRRRYFGSRRIQAGVLAAALSLSNGGCVRVGQEQWVEFLGDLLRNAVAALLL